MPQRAPAQSPLRTRARWPLWLSLLAGVGLSVPGRGRADDVPILQIRARSQLRLTEGERIPDHEGFRLTLRVQLTDQARASEQPPPLGNQEVRVRVLGPGGMVLRSEVLQTDESGQALVQLEGLVPGSYRALAAYEGDDLRDPASEQLVIDLGREPAQLDLDAPPSLDRGEKLRVRVTLTSRGTALQGPVKLRIGPAPERSLRLQLGLGVEELSLREVPGAHKGMALKIEARFPGDTVTAAASASREVWITSQARVSLELPPLPGNAELPQGGSLIVTGQVTDDDGPLAGEPVDLEAGEREPPPAVVPGEPPPPPPGAEAGLSRRVLGSGITDESGRYRVVIKRLALHTGPAFLSAQVWPRRRYILPARSPEQPITVLPPEPVSPLYYLVPLGVTALGVLGSLLMRRLLPRLRELWQALRARKRDDEADGAALLDAAPPAAAAWEASESGVKLSAKHRLPALTLRRTVDTTVDGHVLDAAFGTPVATAQITAEPLAAEPGAAGSERKPANRLGTAASDGRFALIQLPTGRYRVRVTAPGYLPEEFIAMVPHRGDLRGVRVLLGPLRVRILAEWRRVALHLLGAESHVQTRTPRELLGDLDRLEAEAATHVRSPAGRERLHALTQLVEEAYYSPRLPTHGRLEDARLLAEELLQGRSGTPPGDPPAPPLLHREIRAPGAPRSRP